MNLVIGVDVGGTFTDVVCSDGESTWRAKFPTNPQRSADGVLGGIGRIGEQIDASPEQVIANTVRFGLGTTAVTNVLATRKGRNVGVLTTQGFEDELHTARNKRIGEHGWLMKPWNPVPRPRIRGMAERIDRNGDVISPIDPEEVRAAAKELIEREGVDAFAISFLWSFKNGAHEKTAAEVIKSTWPDLPVFCGSELHPIMREYERTTLAMLNAFTAGALDGVEELENTLIEMGLKVPLMLLHSGGGTMSSAEARRTPMALASSGPAAGATAAAEVAMVAGIPDALCCDMGGTSVDVAVVRSGYAERSQRIEIEGITTALAAVDVESIGSGGGSIAWIDSRGLLRVGPISARANPGPVCYGRGGTQPTVTDAMILLGYIDPAAFMGGKMKLDVEGAREACAKLGEKLGYSAIETAYGIREIALAEMGKAVRARISSGGLDPRQYGVIAFGGSGSLFAPPIAQELGFAACLTPRVASVLSAYGAATADLRSERMVPVDQSLPLSDGSALDLLERLIETIRKELESQGVAEADRRYSFEADLRFRRQKSELTVSIQKEDLQGDRLIEIFRREYTARNGANSMARNAPIELSTLRVIGEGKSIRASLPKDLPAAQTSHLEPDTHRLVWTTRNEQASIPVYDMEKKFA
ncbi:hydantoinase/oxoprolinase family protein [Novosphingobium colocasiae]